MKIFLFVFTLFFSSTLFAQLNESKLSAPTHNKKLNYSFLFAVGGIRIDEKYGWDSLRRFNYGLGINVSYKNTLSNEFQFYGNINAYNRFFLDQIWGRGYLHSNHFSKISDELILWRKYSMKIENEFIYDKIDENVFELNTISSLRYSNKKIVLGYLFKVKNYFIFFRTGFVFTKYTKSYTIGFLPSFPLNEPFDIVEKITKTGFVFSPEFRFPFVKRFQAKAGIEWMIFPAKIPNLFEANVGIIYNMKRIKNRIKN